MGMVEALLHALRTITQKPSSLAGSARWPGCMAKRTIRRSSPSTHSIVLVIANFVNLGKLACADPSRHQPFFSYSRTLLKSRHGLRRIRSNKAVCVCAAPSSETRVHTSRENAQHSRPREGKTIGKDSSSKNLGDEIGCIKVVNSAQKSGHGQAPQSI